MDFRLMNTADIAVRMLNAAGYTASILKHTSPKDNEFKLKIKNWRNDIKVLSGCRVRSVDKDIVIFVLEAM